LKVVGCQVDPYPLTPALSPKGARGKGSRSSCHSKLESVSIFQVTGKLLKPEFGTISQVGVSRTNTSVSPLSLRERVRVRGF
jgi:hypothetical protein